MLHTGALQFMMANLSSPDPRRIYLSQPHMSGREMRFVQEAFCNNWLSTVGPNITGLETEFSGLIGRPALAVNSGTSAIHLGLKMIGVQPGQEVVVPTLTFAASCFPVLYQQAKPVFIDCDWASWNMDPQLLADFLQQRARRNRLPRAVIVVHVFGQAADMDPILSICRRYEIPILEDAAEALGATYKNQLAGSMGEVGAFSFNGNKIITSSGGGMVVSPRADWMGKARYWSAQARDPDINYLHSEVGYNYRMSNVLAGIARGQLTVLKDRIAQRRAVALRYQAALAEVAGLRPMPQAPYGQPTYWLSCFTIDPKKFGLNQFELIRWLEADGIESRPVWKPLHTQPIFSSYERLGGGVAEDLNRYGICLPSSSNLSEPDQDRVICRIRGAHQLASQYGHFAVSVDLPWRMHEVCPVDLYPD